jgi:hypothetical protein
VCFDGKIIYCLLYTLSFNSVKSRIPSPVCMPNFEVLLKTTMVIFVSRPSGVEAARSSETSVQCQYTKRNSILEKKMFHVRTFFMKSDINLNFMTKATLLKRFFKNVQNKVLLTFKEPVVVQNSVILLCIVPLIYCTLHDFVQILSLNLISA